ncbi:MAG: hypothetical protein GYA21_11475 [Myxococcales bacterium]|nr:hypothetical protein [Myxococcales bacterium]
MRRNLRTVRPMAPLDESLQAEIKVKRPPKRWQRPFFWVTVLAGALVVVCLMRLCLISWPLVEGNARPPADGYRALKGLFFLRVSDADGRFTGRQGVEEAFRQGYQWLVAADANPARPADLVNEAPFPLVAASLRQNSDGRYLLFGGTEPLPLLSGRRLEDIRGAGGVVVLDALGETNAVWREREVQSFDGILLLDLPRLPSADSAWDALCTGIAALMRLPYRHLAVARRPVEALAHLDNLNRRRHSLLFCGAGTDESGAAAWPALASYVLVPDSQGPWYPREIADALRAGRHYCAMPFLGDPSGFRFFAARKDGTLAGLMGDSLILEPGLLLIADLNLPSQAPGITLRLMLDGLEVTRATGGRLDFRVEKPGAYRIEATLRAPRIPFGEIDATFILSNPIFLSAPGASAPPATKAAQPKRAR